MTHTMIQFSYKPEAIQKLVKNPVDRSIAVKKLVEKLGGKMHSFYYAYGEYDGFLIAELPDNVSVTAAVLAAFNPDTVAKLKTTILISVSEAMEAMKKAQGLTLAAPKG